MIDPNTHEIFIQGNGFNAFVTGVPDTCQHDWSGDEVHFTQSGKTIYWHTFRQWASFTSKMRNRLIYEHQEEIGDPITGGAVTCKHCKKIFHPPMF